MTWNPKSSLILKPHTGLQGAWIPFLLYSSSRLWNLHLQMKCTSYFHLKRGFWTTKQCFSSSQVRCLKCCLSFRSLIRGMLRSSLLLEHLFLKPASPSSSDLLWSQEILNISLLRYSEILGFRLSWTSESYWSRLNKNMLCVMNLKRWKCYFLSLITERNSFFMISYFFETHLFNQRLDELNEFNELNKEDCYVQTWIKVLCM